jgi:hypothetical protein
LIPAEARLREHVADVVLVFHEIQLQELQRLHRYIDVCLDLHLYALPM